MMMQSVGSFAEFERGMLREWTHNGLIAAGKESRVGGHRAELKAHLENEIVNLLISGQKTAAGGLVCLIYARRQSLNSLCAINERCL